MKINTTGYALLIKTDFEKKVIAVKSVEEASSAYRAYVEAENLGASDVHFGKVVDASKKLVATISYNGNVHMEAR